VALRGTIERLEVLSEWYKWRVRCHVLSCCRCLARELGGHRCKHAKHRGPSEPSFADPIANLRAHAEDTTFTTTCPSPCNGHIHYQNHIGGRLSSRLWRFDISSSSAEPAQVSPSLSSAKATWVPAWSQFFVHMTHYSSSVLWEP